MRNTMRAAGAAVLIAAGIAGGVGVAAAQPAGPVGDAGTLARPCNLSVDDFGGAWWRGCTIGGAKVKITYNNRAPLTVCVALNQEKFLGKMPSPVTGAARVGSNCGA